MVTCFFSVSILASFRCAAETKREKALYAIAAIQESVIDLQNRINKQLSDAIFEIGALKEGEDLTEDQYQDIQFIVNSIKNTFFAIPVCVKAQNFPSMEKDDFKKGKGLVAAKTK